MGIGGFEDVEDEEFTPDEGPRAREVPRVVEGAGRQRLVSRVAVGANVQGEPRAAVDVEAVPGVRFQRRRRRGEAPSPAAGRGASPAREGVGRGWFPLRSVDCAVAGTEGDGRDWGFAEGAGGVQLEPLEEAVRVVGGVGAGVCAGGGDEGVEADDAVVAG